jgi:gamma-glutamyl-gamma-aminobutyrate hydrolase PuuD
MKPRVGVTYSVPGKVGPYADAVRMAELEPVLMAPAGPPSLAGLDGLVITGGCDIDPARYGETAHAATSAPDPARDAMEASLIEQALAADLPILAICRGMQMLNVVRGGTLRQDIPGHKVKELDDVHTVAIRMGSRLESILGSGELWVNSRHHQAVGRVGAGLLVSAKAPDGTVEALEDPKRRFVLAVQWHPEERAARNRSDRTLFAAFAAAAGR